MQTMPGMTQQQRQDAGNSWRQFQERLMGNRGYTPAGNNPSQYKPAQQPTRRAPAPPAPAPTQAPDMTAYKPPVVGNAPNGRPVTGAYGKPQPLPSLAPENYYNAAGQRFGVIVDQNPFATQQQLSAGYEQLANSQGYYRPPQPPAAQPSTTSQQAGANAQQPLGGTPMTDAYADWQRRNPGAMPPSGPRPAAPPSLPNPTFEFPISTTYYDWRTGLTTGSPPPPRPADAPEDVYWSAGMDPREVYKSPSPPAQPTRPVTRPEPPRPSPAQPIQPPSQGTPYAPMQPFMYSFGGGGEGNMANLPEEQRLPGFTATTVDPFGNQSAEAPFAQRDAMIELLNRQALPYQMGQRQGMPQFAMPELWQQAGNMVQGGWSNPLAGLFS